MRIVITGGAGFIGSNLTDAMIRRGHQVTVFDNLYRPGSERNLAWLQSEHAGQFRFVRGDIRNPAEIDAAMQGAQLVYHVAAQTAVTTSVTNPRQDFELNALGTFNALEAARLHGDNPIFIFTSTNKVYGGMEDLRVAEEETRYSLPDHPHGIDESRPLDFHSPYGCSKGSADQYVRDYSRIYGLHSVVFRMGAIYGPHQWGSEDQAWVAWFVLQSLLGRPITIYGNGKQVRDVLYVDDLVRAFEQATERIEVTAGQIYNIGGGPQNSLSIWRDFRPLLSRILGNEVPEATFGPWRPGDQPIYISNTSKAAHDFGWRPAIGVDEGVSSLVAWARANRQAFEELPTLAAP